jgi:hypothetical protein
MAFVHYQKNIAPSRAAVAWAWMKISDPEIIAAIKSMPWRILDCLERGRRHHSMVEDSGSVFFPQNFFFFSNTLVIIKINYRSTERTIHQIFTFFWRECFSFRGTPL